MQALPSQRCRQILDDMGLPVWVARDRLLSAIAGSAPVAQTASQPPMQGDGLQRLSRALEDGAPVAVAERPQARTSPVSAPHAESGLPSVQCTWLGQWVFIGQPRTEPKIRRFLRDLLWATAGETGTPQQLGFAAAELARDVGSEQALAALRAFVDKRVDAVQAKGLLVESNLLQGQQWLSVVRPADASMPVYSSNSQRQVPVVILPDLARLMGDGTAKRSCWQQLQLLLALPPSADGS